MKKTKYLFLVLLLALIMPFAVWAEEEAESTASSSESKEAIVYFFRGEGCSHCQEAEEWFESIEEEYGNMFKIIDYETWYNEDNADLMSKVAEARNESAEGVPYIIVGDKSWNGFDSVYKDEIIDAIKEVYNQPESKRVDIVAQVTGNKAETKDGIGGDIIALLIIILIAGVAGFGIYKARSSAK